MVHVVCVFVLFVCYLSNSGKTTELIRRIRRLKVAQRKCLVIQIIFKHIYSHVYLMLFVCIIESNHISIYHR